MFVRKAKIGDIFEIKTPIGLAYAQYTHEGEGMGELVRVLPGIYSSRPVDFAQLANQRELYFVFYTLQYALRAKQVGIVSTQPIPDWARKFPIMRKPGGHSNREHKVLNWYIGHGLRLNTVQEMQQAVNVRELTPVQKKLSIVELWPHPVMVRNLATGWLPEKNEESDLGGQQEQIQGTQKSEKESAIDHYFYFSKKTQAKEASRRLQAKGWAVEVRNGADGKNWLALAKQPAPIGDIEEMRDNLERFAEELGGEYDGWGAPVKDESNLQ